MKSVIRYTSVQKPDGDEYKRIAYWNRFIRVKTESIVIIILIIFSIASGAYRLATGTMDTFWAIVSVVFIFYPSLVVTQFNSSIKYHLKHRNPVENAPCNFCLMNNGILMDVPEFESSTLVRYDELTHVYTNIYGYYMMFQKNKVVAMVKHSDIPDGRQQDFEETMLAGIKPGCKVSKFL